MMHRSAALREARQYAWRFVGCWCRRLEADELRQTLELAVAVGDGDWPTTRRAVRQELERVAAARLDPYLCAVPGCGREELVLRRGRCARCYQRARVGGWMTEDPSGDPQRWQRYRSRPSRVGPPAPPRPPTRGAVTSCRVPGCDRSERYLRRGRCSRCARRAERGGWQAEDPAGDPERYAAYVAARPASCLAHRRLGRPLVEGAALATRQGKRWRAT